MRKVLAPLVVLGFVFGAISIARAATPGVSKDEIKLGVTYVDLDADPRRHRHQPRRLQDHLQRGHRRAEQEGRRQRPQDRARLREDQPDRHRAGAGSVREADRGREGLRRGRLLLLRRAAVLRGAARHADPRRHHEPDVPEAGEGAVDDARFRSGGDPASGRRARRRAATSRARSGSSASPPRRRTSSTRPCSRR